MSFLVAALLVCFFLYKMLHEIRSEPDTIKVLRIGLRWSLRAAIYTTILGWVAIAVTGIS